MPEISLDRKDLNAIARYAYGSGWFGEGEKGGRGNMGLLRGRDGRLRVIKFNTHWGEGGAATPEQIAASNCLREQLLELARSFGSDAAVIQRIRAELGLAADQNPNTGTTLLTRTVVARVVKMIDQDIWTNVQRTDDGTGAFDLATLKSRKENMEFGFVKAENLGLETNDAVTRIKTDRRNSFMSRTVADAIKKLESLPVFGAQSPIALQAFRLAIAETLKLWQTARFSENIENALCASDEPGQALSAEKRQIKQQLEDLVRVNFARLLIISGRTDDAKAYVRENAKTENAWDSFAPLVRLYATDTWGLQKDRSLQKWFLVELNRFHKDKEHPWELYGRPDKGLCDPLADMPKAFSHRLAAAVFSSSNDRNQIGQDEDLQTRQKLWEEIDGLPKGFLPKRVIDEIKAVISGGSNQFATEDVEIALAAYKAPIDRERIVGRLSTACEGKVSRAKLDALLTKLQTMVFVDRLKAHRQKDLTLDACVDWLEKNPAFLRQLDRRLKLPQDEENLKTDIKSEIVSQFVKNDTVNNFGGTPETGVYMLSIREYDDRELTINGESIPAVPSEGFVMPKDGTSGTDSSAERKAATEALLTKIENLAQRKLVSFLLSMADGLQGALNEVVNKQNGMLSCEDLMLTFGDGQFTLIPNQCRRFCDMKFGQDGSIRLKMAVGSGLQTLQFLGSPLIKGVPLVADSYEVEITIPKPGPDFKGGCPEFTIDSIRPSNVDLQM